MAASWRKIISPPEGVSSARQSYYSIVEKLETPDPATVVFRLKFATGAFLPALADPFTWIYKKAILGATFQGRFFNPQWRRHFRRPIVIGWVGPLFWPDAYADFVDYTFYPYAYDTFCQHSTCDTKPGPVRRRGIDD